jgi:hypothetical protein
MDEDLNFVPAYSTFERVGAEGDSLMSTAIEGNERGALQKAQKALLQKDKTFAFTAQATEVINSLAKDGGFKVVPKAFTSTLKQIPAQDQELLHPVLFAIAFTVLEERKIPTPVKFQATVSKLLRATQTINRFKAEDVLRYCRYIQQIVLK